MGDMTKTLPKPLVPLGEKPILWHIMKTYSHYGLKEFVICCGYKTKKFYEFVDNLKEDWNVEISSLVDRDGKEVTKSQRIKNIEGLINDKEFFVSYGDDLCDVNPNKI